MMDVIERFANALSTGSDPLDLLAPDGKIWYSTTRVHISVDEKRKQMAASASSSVSVEDLSVRRFKRGAILDYVAAIGDSTGKVRRTEIVCIVTVEDEQIALVEEYVLET
jgi:hypothetical protein